ncbi:endolytic transglycosylase MltG [Streptomyces sp. ZYX-F-203]
MTEYGRGSGSAPWHPQDPSYGDGGWDGRSTEADPAPFGGSTTYPGQPPRAPYDAGWRETPYADGGQADPWRLAEDGGRRDRRYAAADPGASLPGDEEGRPDFRYPDPTDPYGGGGDPADHGYDTGYHDPYNTEGAYPPPAPPGRRGPSPREEEDTPSGVGARGRPGGGSPRRVDAGRARRRAPRGGGRSKKNRTPLACLMVCLVLGGGALGVTYFGYQFYQERFGSAPDFEGDGNGEPVSVTIPEGAGGSVIGQELKRQGVVKSIDAFVAALQSHPEGKSIQDGVYTLEKEMSAQAAIELMLSPESRDNLIIAEGRRNAEIYRLIDERLEVADGTTAKAAENGYRDFGLPDWALDHEDVKDPLEGFLFPSSYAVSKGQRPEDVLKQMVRRADESYRTLGLEDKAEGLGLDDPWQLLTVASLVQAEGRSHDDFRKMAEVIYNRREPNPQTNGMLEFDSTYNYIKNQSEIDLTLKELRTFDNPYNTYFYKGLPPGPISNPGEEALRGALSPTNDGWYYFISLDGDTSRFTRTNAEHEKLVQEFNESRKQ